MSDDTEEIAPEPADPRIGTTLLGKLRVVRRLGAGGRGIVYEVEHLITRHRRALKVLRPELSTSGEEVARLVREAGVAGALRSPYLVETYDAGRLPDGSTYVLMELLEGRSLRAAIEAEGPLAPERAARVVAEVCAGLEAVHAAGIVHRDLKPENVFLTPEDGGGERVRILDFGLMKRVGGAVDTFGALTADDAAVGTPEAMAPEQLDGGPIDARTDVYALGVVLYEALSGQRPFSASSPAALMRQIARGERVPLAEAAPGIDPALVAIVDRAMALAPKDRFSSARALADALAPFAGRADRTQAADPLALAPGSAFLDGRYTIVRPLRAGGMGSLYEVVHRDTRRRRALKVMRPSLAARGELRERFAREATIAAEVDSEHVVEVFDAGVDAATGAPFLVMELLRGEELGERLGRAGPLSADEVVELVFQAALALDKTHARGIVHRDLKPANLFRAERDDGSPRLVVLDFGIAELVEGHGGDPATGPVLGTPLYMAPEQLDDGARVGPAADVYALGHIAYALLTGGAYFEDEARDGLYRLFARVTKGAPEPATVRAARRGVTLPAAFDAWFARATALEPSERHASAAELCDALAAALGVTAPRRRASPARDGSIPEPTNAEPTNAEPTTRWSRGALPIALALLGAGAASAWLLRSPSPPVTISSGAAPSAAPIAGPERPVIAEAPSASATASPSAEVVPAVLAASAAASASAAAPVAHIPPAHGTASSAAIRGPAHEPPAHGASAVDAPPPATSRASSTQGGPPGGDGIF